MFLPKNDKQFGFWKMCRNGMSNISIANQLGITRHGVSQALHLMSDKNRCLVSGDGAGKPDPD